MKSLLKGIQAWRSRRKQRSLESWERIRAQGKTRFVVRSAITCSFMVVGATDAIDHTFFSGTYSISLVTIIFYVLFGILIGPSAWSDREAKYKKALDEARVKALSDSTNLPDSQGVSKAISDSA